ncbi:hypothetical protein OK016_13165 [Vibrio chagasii]|nr:hypothetical protein [Vibrio chagasii]
MKLGIKGLKMRRKEDPRDNNLNVPLSLIMKPLALEELKEGVGHPRTENAVLKKLEELEQEKTVNEKSGHSSHS